MTTSFVRLAILARGQAAMRAIRAVREYNWAYQTRIASLAFYAASDRAAAYVREADESFCLGPATFADRAGIVRDRYFEFDGLKQAMASARVDAVWPGWGVLAGRWELAHHCEQVGIVFVGPPPPLMAKVQRRVDLRRLVKGVGVAVMPWCEALADVDDARRAADQVGYPLLLKAGATNGWWGTWLVDQADALETAVRAARREFGDEPILLEPRRRHRLLEVTVAADRYGTVWPLGVLDCTVTRRLRRILIATPAPGLTAEEIRRVEGAAEAIFRRLDYQGLGAVEFYFDDATRDFFFSELHPRLQPDHSVTEVVTGLDLVQLQLHLARGGRLSGSRPFTTMHAVDIRLHAEDATTFQAAKGTIVQFRPPTGPGVRTDSGFDEHDVLAPEYDSHLAVVTAWGTDRTQALSCLVRSLSEAAILMAGGATNKGFLLWLLQRSEIRSGLVDTGWLDGLIAVGAHAHETHSEVALIAASLEQYDDALRTKRARFFESVVRLRPQLLETSDYTAELWYQGRGHRARVLEVAPDRFRVILDGAPVEVHRERIGRFAVWLEANGQRYRVHSLLEGAHHRLEVEGIMHTVDRLGTIIVGAPHPAVVVRTLVSPGDVVSPGDPLVVLEAMKIESTLASDVHGRVRELLVRPNTQVGTGSALLCIEPEEKHVSVPGGDAPRVEAAGDPPEALPDRLRYFLLGYDVQGDGLVERWLAVPFDAAAQEHDAQLLEIFADIVFLFRRRSPEEGPGPSVQEHFYSYLRHLDGHGTGLPAGVRLHLVSVLRHYGIQGLERNDRLEEALYRIFESHVRTDGQVPLVLGILQRWAVHGLKIQNPSRVAPLRALLERLLQSTQGQFQTVAYLARELSFQLFEGARLEQARYARHRRLEGVLELLVGAPDPGARYRARQQLLSSPDPVIRLLSPETQRLPDLLEMLVQSYYRSLATVQVESMQQRPVAIASWPGGQAVAVAGEWSELADLQHALQDLLAGSGHVPTALDLYLHGAAALGTAEVSEVLGQFVEGIDRPATLRRVAVVATGRFRTVDVHHLTFLREAGAWQEQRAWRGLHPAAVDRMGLASRLEAFTREWVPCDEDVYLCRAEARSNAQDVRLIAVSELFFATPETDSDGRVTIPELDWMLGEVLTAIRKVRARRATGKQDWLNWILLYAWPDMGLSIQQIRDVARRLAPGAVISLRCSAAGIDTTASQHWDVLIMNSEETGPSVEVLPASNQPLEPLDEYAYKVMRLRQRGSISPYEVVRLLTHCGEDMVRPGEFVEHDLVDGRLQPASRPPGRNVANLVVGVVRNFTSRYPEGMKRVILLGDPSRAMGAVAEPECRRMLAALDLAQELQTPLDWFAVSAGARIAMDSGVENMDWIARVLARIVRFTQGGGEINVVVDGINVGAQPYWNAEATMLMHTRGVLIMTPRGAMVLTGKKALDYSGSVSGDDNSDIGGYDRIMGPNGQAQYWARNLHDACVVLLRHYDHTYIAPGERTPRRATSSDPVDRDVRSHPYVEDGSGFSRIGDVFSEDLNPGRKKPFDIRQIMGAVIDTDHPPLERWANMAKAGTAVVWNAHLGGYPVCLIGFESHPLPRMGFIPVDGPSQWTSGTLFPQSSRKVARAINSASGLVPVVVLANLSGFDGSPESLRRWQLEYGAEIGRAVVNFQGPIVFCVVSRYHGGAYVVFSHVLNANLHIAALEGSFASVIGGAPAAAVVFSGEVDRRVRSDPRLVQLEAEIAVPGSDKTALRAAWLELSLTLQAEKLGEVAGEFDGIHTVERALAVGALHCIIPAARLRPHLVEALETGLRRAAAEEPPAVR